MLAASNYEAAMKAESKRVTRCFHQYDSETRALHAASFRLGYQKRRAVGEFFYIHPDFPTTAFPTRAAAARAALSKADTPEVTPHHGGTP
jgi:hypothetical protein